jgi:hypothetical protein
MEMPPKITLQINDGLVHATAGQTEVKLDQTNQTGGTVTVLAGSTKIIMNQDGDITIEAKGAMTLKAAKDISIEGMNINLKSTAKTSIDAGSTAEIKANAEAKLQGQASASVKSSGITEISGTLVKIN